MFSLIPRQQVHVRAAKGAKSLTRRLRAATLIAPLLAYPIASDACSATRIESHIDDASASAPVAQCLPLAKITEEIVSEGGRLIQLAPEQFQFARGMFVALRPEGARPPPGRRAMLAETRDGDVAMIFIDGDKACALYLINTADEQLLIAVGYGTNRRVASGL